MMIQAENGLMVEISKEGQEIAKRIQERQEPLNSISAYYEEARKVEAEAQEKAHAYAIATQPPQAMSTDEQIQALTKLVEQLTAKVGEK